jgi:DNA-binding MurR/RpiR family transcriptional regulator
VSGDEGTVVDESGHAANVSVAERIRTHLRAASAAERRIGRTLLANYPAAGLDTAGRLASAAGVSTASVVRYVAALGFAGYREFQDTLREELDVRRFSPLAVAQQGPGGGSTSELRMAAAELFRRGIQESLNALPDHEIEQAVRLLTDPRRRITCIGGRFSHLLAEYLELHLRLLRPGTRVLDVRPSDVAPFLVDVDRRDVCVVFDYRRYQRDVIDVARAARGRGASIVLFTDPWMSGAAGAADVVLAARVEGASPFDSFVAAVAVVETVLAAVLRDLPSDATSRMGTIDRSVRDATTD